MYGPREAAQILKTSESTLRRWAAQYKKHLSESAQRAGGKRFYTPDDLAILSQVRDLTRKHKSQAEIEALLGIVEPEKPPPPPDQDTQIVPYLAREFQSLHDQLSQFQADQEAREKRLQDQIDALRAELEANKKEPFFRRLFRSSKPGKE